MASEALHRQPFPSLSVYSMLTVCTSILMVFVFSSTSVVISPPPTHGDKRTGEHLATANTGAYICPTTCFFLSFHFRFIRSAMRTVRSGIVPSRERKVGFWITMKGKCQSGSAVISTGPQVVKQRLHAPLILVIFPADPPAGLHLAFSLYEDNFDPRLVLYVFKKCQIFRSWTCCRTWTDDIQSSLTSPEWLLLLVQANQHLTVAVMQTCQMLCFAARLGMHDRMGANRENRVWWFHPTSWRRRWEGSGLKTVVPVSQTGISGGLKWTVIQMWSYDFGTRGRNVECFCVHKRSLICLKKNISKLPAVYDW